MLVQLKRKLLLIYASGKEVAVKEKNVLTYKLDSYYLNPIFQTGNISNNYEVIFPYDETHRSSGL